MANVGRRGLWQPAADRFEEWLRIPVPGESTDPRFDVRRARPAEFETIYDVVDETFGFQRPRALYDWLYRRNPYGTARCWVVLDRAGARIVASAASWPWPMAHAAEPLEGVLGGDWVIAPQWQGHGIGMLRSAVRRSHPWHAKGITLSWPNELSRGVAAKRGHLADVLGPVPRAVLLLNTGEFLAARQWPALLVRVAGRSVDAGMDSWRRLTLRGKTGLVIEEVRRFDAAFDDVTERCMAWPGLWSPHAADFLNWRYLDHPVYRYVALALVANAAVAGYAVLRTDTQAPWLMEFAAPDSPRELPGALLQAVIQVAREAGCACLTFSAPPGWHHWRLFRRAGFLPTPSKTFAWPLGDAPGITRLDAWQWVPGDMDDL